jgi:prophage tail gpP-like protein
MDGYEPQFIDESDDDRELERFIIADGETVERAMRRATLEFGYNLQENEDGDVVLKPKDAEPETGPPLILGEAFTEWSVKRDIAPRYSKVTAKGNAVPTDEKYGQDAEELAGEAIDEYVEFKRELHILVDSDQDHETLKSRAISEANRRKGKGLNVTLTMSTWSDGNGDLWKIDKHHDVVIPVDQVDDELQISGVTFQLDKEKRRTSLTLVPIETFTQETKSKGKDRGKKKKKAAPAQAKKKPFAKSVEARPIKSRFTYGLGD